ncbi:MAG: hypothetical protein AAFY46_00660, partial [Planctomycetota bacterium]
FITAGHAYVTFFHNAEQADRSVPMLPPIGGACLVLVALLTQWGTFEARMRVAWLAMLLDMSTIRTLIAPAWVFRDMVLERNEDS